MKILVVSGFLGAGKTTFIQELVRRTGRDFAIYENEYGQADIDARRLRQDSDLKVWESTENCICCSGKQDFATSVLTISNTIDPEYLIVEPTGVAKLQSILDNVNQVAWERISLLAPVTVVDAVSWQNQRTDFPEIFDNQLSAAASVVVSKLASGSEDAAEPIKQLAAEMNPQAEVIAESSYADIPDEWWNGLLTRALDGSVLKDSASEKDEGPDLETMALTHAELPSPTHLIWLLDAASAGVFGKLARAKGTLPCGNQWVKFDLVERAWAITGDEPQEESRCVFIGRDLLRHGLREVFVPAFWHEQSDLADEHDHSHCDHEHGYCEHEHCDHEHGHCEHEHGEHAHEHDHEGHAHAHEHGHGEHDHGEHAHEYGEHTHGHGEHAHGEHTHGEHDHGMH
ncbi:CobW/P47K family protein [Atopobium sp. ICM42b]|uniref:GTP-binding protein n=1 Tax=Atopobium sp. ICM42b TaxID=1190620 RepID=UPI00044C1A0A|nr:GTP-binding protein [Atopobium sp. ICM42b]EWC94334.1 CobW/P47K family protein [Atopobium sp. ICM42b]